MMFATTLLILLCLFAINSIALAVPPQAQCQDVFSNEGSSDLALPMVNTTPVSSKVLLGDMIDERLKPVYTIDPTNRLCATSAYMVVLKTMSQLSIHAWQDKCFEGLFAFDDYANVKVLIKSHNWALKFRHAILGLYQTMKIMTEKKSFIFVVAELFWEETPQARSLRVGDITIYPDPLPVTLGDGGARDVSTLAQNGRMLTQDYGNTTSTSSGINGSGTMVCLQAGDWDVKYNFRGVLIPPSAMYMALTTAMVHISQFPATDTVQPFTSRNDVSGRTILKIKPVQSRQLPELFQYYNVALLLTDIGRKMLAERKFEEVDFVFELGGIPAGKGSLLVRSLG